MKHFVKIADGIDVVSIAVALNVQPNLWNRYGERREFEGTAHRSTSDIWLRYNDPKNLDRGYDAFNGPHDAVWYPEIAQVPQVRQLAMWLMGKVQASRLGGVLITKIPAGQRVLPHVDRGWHPEHYNVKVYVPIQTNAKCVNRVGDERVVMATGEAWHFDNTVEHEVHNGGDDDRITAIICMRVDP